MMRLGASQSKIPVTWEFDRATAPVEFMVASGVSDLGQPSKSRDFEEATSKSYALAICRGFRSSLRCSNGSNSAGFAHVKFPDRGGVKSKHDSSANLTLRITNVVANGIVASPHRAYTGADWIWNFVSSLLAGKHAPAPSTTHRFLY